MSSASSFTNPTLEEVASVLDKAKIRDGVLRACCPAHGGDDPNLAITYEGDKLLATCHSHECRFEDIMAAIRGQLGQPERAQERPKKRKARSRQTWELRDEAGKLVAVHVRDDAPEGKKVWWRLPSGKSGLGGLHTAELPLYGSEDAARAPWVVLTEGEKAADALRASRALREAGIGVLGTVTGAAGTPSAETLAVLRGKRVVLWPDHDTAGIEHMGRVAQALDGVAEEVRWFEWEDAPERGDAADHPDLDALAPALKLAPRWSKPPAIGGRMLVGQAIERGVDPPAELLPDMLLASKAHNIYAPGGVGKTWLLVWIATELVRAGKRVVVFDLENGLRTYAERFDEMGADPKQLDELLYYYPFPMFDRTSYEKMLDEVEPECVMFDSWIGFLATDGRDENVSNDISAWADAYIKPSLRRGSAIVVLDHVPHEHERERGSSRKRDEMDVVWKLTKAGDFDREQMAELSMTLKKDREGWLPFKLGFSIGGDPDTGRFVMERDDALARVPVDFITRREKVALDALAAFDKGARAKDWLEAIRSAGEEISRRTLYRLKDSLIQKDKVKEVPEDTTYGGVPNVRYMCAAQPAHIGNLGAPGYVRVVRPSKEGRHNPRTYTSTASPEPDVQNEGDTGRTTPKEDWFEL